MALARTCGLLLATLALVVLVSGPTLAACPGVTHTTLMTKSWQVDSFFDGTTMDPLPITLTVSFIGSGTTVEYFNGSSWTEVHGSIEATATAVRTTRGGLASMTYKTEICEEDIHLQDE